MLLQNLLNLLLLPKLCLKTRTNFEKKKKKKDLQGTSGVVLHRFRSNFREPTQRFSGILYCWMLLVDGENTATIWQLG